MVIQLCVLKLSEQSNMKEDTSHFPTRYGIVSITVVILIGCLSPQVSSQTVNIADVSAPVEGTELFKLECLISNFEITGDHILVWSKNDSVLAWSKGTVTIVDTTGDYEFQEFTDINGVVNFILIIGLVKIEHAGMYKCIIAEGNLMNYNEVASATIDLTIESNHNRGDPYLPSIEWPKCFPQSDVRGIIHTGMTFRCITDAGNPKVSVNLYVNGQLITESSDVIMSGNLIEMTYTFTVMPHESYDNSYCTIISPSFQGTSRSCHFGKIQAGLILVNEVHVQEGEDATFNCAAGDQDIVEWSTDPQIETSRIQTVDASPSSLKILNVELTDNETTVICIIEAYSLQDQAQLIVIPRNDSGTDTTILPSTTTSDTTFNISTGSAEESSTNVNESQQVTSLPTPMGTTKTNTNASSTLDTPIIALIAGGSAFLILVLIVIIVGCVCCCKQQANSDKVDDDGAPTRISTGYEWDRELSKRIHDSPMPSPRLSDRNHNHARARQVLKEPDEGSSKMSPALAYALANLSDDDLDSDIGDTLKKPIKKPDLTYQSIEDPSLSNLNHAPSVHSNLYAPVSSPAPSNPAPAPPSQGSVPTYAVPDKVKQSIKKEAAPIYASTNRTPQRTEDVPPENPQYAFVHPDPENPKVRTLSQNRGLMNAAYKSDEQDSEGFVANTIYEPGV